MPRTLLALSVLLAASVAAAVTFYVLRRLPKRPKRLIEAITCLSVAILTAAVVLWYLTPRRVLMQTQASLEVTKESDGFTIPSFPLPAPRPSAQLTIPVEHFRTSADKIFLGDIGTFIERELIRSGYPNYSFYGLRGGFALVAQIEQIRDDGTPIPEPDRWTTVPFQKMERFSLGEYLRVLLLAPKGRYRVVAFLVSNAPLTTSGTVDMNTAMRWVLSGANRLPQEIYFTRISDQHAVTAYIYEFFTTSSKSVQIIQLSQIPAGTHLHKSGLTFCRENNNEVRTSCLFSN